MPRSGEMRSAELRSPERGLTPEAQDKILAGFSAFNEQYGKPGVEALMQRIQEKGTLQLDDVRETMESMATREELRERVLSILERRGVVERHGDQMVVDLDAMKKVEVNDFRRAKHRLGEKKGSRDYRNDPCHPYLSRGRQYVFYLTFKDLSVISKQEWHTREKGQSIKPKPLFYAPETMDEALDPDAIRQKDFYLGLWELPNFMGRGEDEAKDYPNEGESLNFNEVTIATMVFHPKYGDGKRDEKGRLMVRDPKTREYVPISGQWFVASGFRGGGYGTGIEGPTRYLESKAPEIMRRGLLKTVDFIQRSSGKSQETRLERTKISPSGELFMNQVSYYFGRSFVGKPTIKVYEISPGMGGIVEVDGQGNEKLTHTFNLYAPDDPKLKPVSFGKRQYGRAGAELVKLNDIRTVQKKQAEESMEAYKRRVEAIENFQAILHISKSFEKVGVNLSRLSVEEQDILSRMMSNRDENQRKNIVAFTKVHGLSGLRAFLSAETDNEQGARIMGLGEDLGPVLAAEIFRRYGQIMDTANREVDEISKTFFENDQKLDREQKEILRGELTRRAKQMLADFAGQVSEIKAEKKQIDLADVLSQLDKAKGEMIVFAGVFKTAFKGSKEINLESVRGLVFAEKLPKAMSEHDKKEMMSIAQENWAQMETGIPGISELVLRGLSSKLESANLRSRFSVLSKNGHILAFVRFDERPDLGPDTVYAGSLNVAPEARGSAIGEAVMRNTIDREAERHTIVADVFPEVLAGTSYVENFGFVVTGVESIIVKDPKTGRSREHKRLLIRRDDQRSNGYVLRRPELTKRQIMAMANGQTPDGIQVRRYDLSREKDRFLQDIASLSNSGMVGTRYLADPHDPNVRYLAFEPSGITAKRAA